MSNDDSNNSKKTSRRGVVKAALGATAASALGVTAAEAHNVKKMKKDTIEFSSMIDPDALDEATIRKISDGIARQMAKEAEALKGGTNLHIRFGGGHSRSFSRTSEHKNVSHSRVVVAGSGGL